VPHSILNSKFRRDVDMDLTLSDDDESEPDNEGAMDLNSDDDGMCISGYCDSLDEDDSPDW
jgi:hypothetical protein